MAGPASRRGFLGALAAIPSAGLAPAPAADATAEAETLFARWLALQDEMAAASGFTDEWLDAMDERARALEGAVRACGPSMTRAAILALFALRYDIAFLFESPTAIIRGDSPTPERETAVSAALLAIAAPHTRGLVREVAADFLAHPDREVRNSRLFGCRQPEETLS